MAQAEMHDEVLTFEYLVDLTWHLMSHKRGMTADKAFNQMYNEVQPRRQEFGPRNALAQRIYTRLMPRSERKHKVAQAYFHTLTPDQQRHVERYARAASKIFYDPDNPICTMDDAAREAMKLLGGKQPKGDRLILLPRVICSVNGSHNRKVPVSAPNQRSFRFLYD